ncbi:elongation factor Ts [bacterium (Candidatus Gribaldobacteria) CG08_land_8_20_14_0_20_39_15]|uniref:Elongation factor Ts n=1 Tax=bacterium (Candidatus Gribaldobacteria) CG08_land_8_20_14_0_20_39_15 TaxID=2014273 RepID=A0A2M6XU81_9BACT|nr:MAG: elongation factor Ts [bacterium (Candidatus Gribaldobacteria) CG08_land_8_20_14_0_20_39_15]
MLNIDLLKQLREQTGISMMECKKALEESNGDLKRAKEILREKGKELIKGRESRAAGKGIIKSYIHANGKIGVLLQINCESDFVAKSEPFISLAHELCLQIAASVPLFVKTSEISEALLEQEKKIYRKQFADSGKPAEMLEKIVNGKLEKYKKEVSLLSQPWVKDPNKTVQELVEEARVKTGENIEVVRFTRFEV